MLLLGGEKMSKSLGNVMTIRDALELAPGEAIRLLFLHTHYRGVLDFRESALRDARRELDRFYRALQTPADPDSRLPDSVLDALCDDLNTPLALSAMHGLADAALAGDRAASGALRASGRVLGLLGQEPEAWFRGDGDSAWIEARIAERLEARRARDYARADAIRAELAAQGVLLEDTAGGTTWRRE
jgi:cysteinyl-tRNA synthetase